MSEAEHDLVSEFPGARDVLHRLKMDDAHFQLLSHRYHQLSKDIARVETGIEAAGDARLEDMKKRRLALLDEIAVLIEKGRPD